jgi:hypothetical protein
MGCLPRGLGLHRVWVAVKLFGREREFRDLYFETVHVLSIKKRKVFSLK